MRLLISQRIDRAPCTHESLLNNVHRWRSVACHAKRGSKDGRPQLGVQPIEPHPGDILETSVITVEDRSEAIVIANARGPKNKSVDEPATGIRFPRQSNNVLIPPVHFPVIDKYSPHAEFSGAF